LDTLTATLKQLENQRGEAQKRLDDLQAQVVICMILRVLSATAPLLTFCLLLGLRFTFNLNTNFGFLSLSCSPDTLLTIG